MNSNEPARGDTIRWTEHRPGRKPRTYTGKVQTVHPDRWLVMVGPGKLHNLSRADWDATGEVLEHAARRLVAVVS